MNSGEPSSQNLPLRPGATIGMLGGGQLGRMFALAARPMGYRVHVYAPEHNSPAGQVSDHESCAEYGDEQAFDAFLNHIDILTYEFENVPLDAVSWALEFGVDVRPGRRVLETAQDRSREKRFFAEIGLPNAPFAVVTSLSELELAAQKVGFPSVLKTTRFGYDGKGQQRLEPSTCLHAIWERYKPGPALLEAWIDFKQEISVVGARGVDGSTVLYPPVENRHSNHILDTTIAPASLPEQTMLQAQTLTTHILNELEVVGLICVEFFVLHDDSLLVNEIAPRPHNSGHWTIEGSATSQFAQQLRAVCALPLGSTVSKRPAAMVNLLGDLWEAGEPDWHRIFGVPEAVLHLYGKDSARAGRKMGHITATAANVNEAVQRAQRARHRLSDAAA